MSSTTFQTIIGAFFSLMFLTAVYRLGRSQRLSFRYTVGWMILGALGVLAGLLIPVAEPIAKQLQVAPSALLGVGAVILLVVLCVQLSISISGLQEQVRRIAEETAFLRQEIEEVSNLKKSSE
jgi:uncharacterized membrane protein YhaH (DUF805 family)